MSETKRATLTTLQPQKVSEKVNRNQQKTVRISVVLPESNEDNCPEYNYKDELAAVKRKSRQIKNANSDNHGDVPNGLGPFEEDDDVRKIALEMEAKYGNYTSNNKKKRKGRRDDYADIGMGYDESDSFIDNTDGYDEIIPQNVTTLHGGFYINCGALEFKTDDEATSDFSSSSDSEASDKEGNQTKRKRILETTDEEGEGSEKTDIKKQKPKVAGEHAKSATSMHQAIKKKMFSQHKIQVKKRRPIIDPLKKTVKELLREKRQDLNITATTPETEGEKPALDAAKETKKSPPLPVATINATIESVVKSKVDKKISKLDYDSNGNKNNVDVNNSKDVVSKTIVDAPLTLEDDSSHESTKIEKVEIVKLPENLPANIIAIIDGIKAVAANYKEGKVKFFTDEVNAMFLKLETQCKCIGKPSKLKIYEHLSPFVKCRKETLIKRAKNLVLEDESKKLKRLINSLTDEINKAMPLLLSNHETETQKVLKKKFSQESLENEENKNLRMPKRRFLWTEQTKKLMRDIMFTKKRCLLLEGKQKDTHEDQINSYLKSLILPLWPEGWISVAALKKVCTAVTELKKVQSVQQTKHSTSSLQLNHNNLSIIPLTNNSVPKNNAIAKSDDAPTAANHDLVSKVSASQKSAAATPKPPALPPPLEDKQRTTSDFGIKKIMEEKPVDNSVIVVNKLKEETNSVIEANNHCQIIDLTDSEVRKKMKMKVKPVVEEKRPHAENNLFKAITKDIYNERKMMKMTTSGKKAEDFTVKNLTKKDVVPLFTSTPIIEKCSNRNEGDDIQEVMENLKALRQLSSPIKQENSLSSPVSVIAFNKSFAPKTSSSQSSSQQRTNFKGDDFNSLNYQDEFQKQLFSSIGQLTSPTSSKSNYRCS